MTTRHCSYLVVLDHDIREDDAEVGVLNALRMVKGVQSVTPVSFDDVDRLGVLTALDRSNRRWREGLLRLLDAQAAEVRSPSGE